MNGSLEVAIQLAQTAREYFERAMFEATHKPFFGELDPWERTRFNVSAGCVNLRLAIDLGFPKGAHP